MKTIVFQNFFQITLFWVVCFFVCSR